MLSKLFWKYPISYIWAKHGLKFKVVSLNPKKQFFVHLASYSGPVLEPFLLQKKQNRTVLVLVSNSHISGGRSNLPGINPETLKGC